MTTNYLQIYDLEKYLFEDVNEHFHQNHSINAFDFFCIVIWKANRAKSIVAKRLLKINKNGNQNLNEIVHSLTLSLYEAMNSEQRMKILIEKWGFALPMASAILTVLWPDDFTIYDYRVCSQIQKSKNLSFQNIGNKSKFADIWKGYIEFKNIVEELGPGNVSLRDKDRFIFGKSFTEQLTTDIDNLFHLEADQK